MCCSLQNMLSTIILFLFVDISAAFLLKANATQACEDVTYINCNDSHVCSNPDLKKLCPVTCGVCIPQSQCVDATYIKCTDKHVCGDATLRKLCPLTCGLCTTPKPIPKCVDSTYVTCNDSHVCVDPVLKKLCPLTCGGCGATTSKPQACVDKDPLSCHRYSKGLCSRFVNFAQENCQATCGLCSKQIATKLPTTPSTTNAGCYYKGITHQQNETWNDGCDYKCLCRDAQRGFYVCTSICTQWNLPDSCTMDKPAPGLCCSTPSCPPNIKINYPPGYTVQ